MRRRRGTLTLRREDGRIVCGAVTVADSTFRRMRGLLGRGSLQPGHGITLRPAWSIHTAFMRFPIDVVFIDAEQTVIRVEPNLRPFKTASCRGAREVVELAAGECERRGLAAGDRIAWASRSATSTPAPGSGTLTSERRGTILVASADQRFIKLARFLLEGRDLAVGETPVTEPVSDMFADTEADAILLDAGTSVGHGLRALNAARTHCPGIPVVLVAEAPGGPGLESVRVYDKWQESEAAIDAVELAAVGPSAG